MSFLVPFIADLGVGEFVGGAAAEATGSAAVGGAVAGQVNSSIANTVVSKIEQKGQDLLYSVFGKEAVDNAESKVTNFVNSAEQSAKSIFGLGTTPSGPSGRDPFNMDSFGLSSKKYTEDTIPKTEQETTGSCTCSTPLDNQLSTTESLVSSNSALQLSTNDSNNVQTDSVSSSQPSTPVKSMTVPTKDPVQLGKDLGQFISVTNSIKTNNPQKDPASVFKDATDMYPGLSYLVPKILDHSSLTVQPNTRMYQEIYKVYNGKGLSYDQAYWGVDANGNKTINAKDELGQLYTWTVETGKYTLPTLWGHFCGPFSANNALPIGPGITDLASFFHDCLYKKFGGFGHLRADYELISRLSQNLDGMSPQERIAAKVAINYFSTIGHSLAVYRGTLPISVSQAPINTPQANDDILPKLIPEAVQSVDYPIIRRQFYKSLEDSLQTADTTSNPLYSGVWNPQSFQNKLLVQELDEMLVEIY